MRVLGVALALLIGCDDGATADPPLQLADMDVVADMADAPDQAADMAVEDAAPPDMAAPGPIFTVNCDAVPEVIVEEIDLGEVSIGTGGTLGQAFTVPDDAIAFTIVLLDALDASLMAVTHLTDPEGTAWVSPMPEGYRPSARDQFLGPFPGGFFSPNRSTASATGASALLVPNNPAVRVIPGDWQARFAAVSPFTGRNVSATAQVKVLIKRAAEPPSCGRLPLHLFFTGARDWTAATAPDDPDFQQALRRMQTFYAGVGITLDPITYDDVEDGPRSVDVMGSAMNELFATNSYGDGVGIFFVERITSPFGGGIGGVAGGVPGPTLQPSTPRSGVVVATETDPNPDAIGHIMGHEAGHYLGLFHTIEFIGVQDQIEDTSPSQQDMSNLMFPTVTPDEATISPGQGWVLHKNASVIAEVPR